VSNADADPPWFSTQSSSQYVPGADGVQLYVFDVP
jgi:hypothetical protein